MSADVRLYVIAASNSCIAVERMLDHKRIAHRRVTFPPGVHRLAMRAHGFPRQTVPGLTIDGRPVQGSLRISRALDELRPDPPLFPRDAARRAAVERAERRGEEMQKATRRIFYAVARRNPQVVSDVLGARFGPGWAFALRVVRPAFVAGASYVHHASDDAARRDLQALPGMLDEIEAWLADGTLGGEQPNAADFQIAGAVRPLLVADDLRPLAEGRPWAAYVRRIVPDYPGRLPAALPAGWLPAG